MNYQHYLNMTRVNDIFLAKTSCVYYRPLHWSDSFHCLTVFWFNGLLLKQKRKVAFWFRKRPREKSLMPKWSQLGLDRGLL